MDAIHPIQRRLLAEELSLRRRADEERRYAACQRRGRIDSNPHQVDAVIFALRRIREGGCLLADEVGLGKTIGREDNELHERALLYVALTRAKTQALLVVPRDAQPLAPHPGSGDAVRTRPGRAGEGPRQPAGLQTRLGTHLRCYRT